MVATLRCRYGQPIDLKKRQGRDYRIPQGSDVLFDIEILDSDSFDWWAYTPRAEFRRNFRDKAPEVLGTAIVSRLNVAQGAPKRFRLYLPFSVTDLFRVLKGTWDLELFHDTSTIRPVSESEWVLSPQTTE